MDNNYVCETYDEKFSTLQLLLESNYNIYLYGCGNNGKTFIVKKLCLLLKDKYNFVESYDPNLNEINKFNKYINDNNYRIIIESNINNSEYFRNLGFKIIFYIGKYDKNTNEYV